MIEELKRDPFILDLLFKDIYYYNDKWNYLEKYLYYRSTTYKIDADVSLYLCELYKKIYSYIDEKAIIQNQKYNDKEIRNMYEIVSKGQCLRGETLVNGMEIIKRIAIIKSQKFFSSDRDIDLIQNIILKDESLLELLDEHIKLCYSVGNFVPIPLISKSLNQAKGQLCYEEPHCRMGRKDFFYDGIYPYLINFYNYFVNNSRDNAFIKIVNENYRKWLSDTYGKGKEGWDKFVEYNYLTYFVDGNNIPKKYYVITGREPLDDVKDYIKNINADLKERNKKILGLL